MKTLAFFFVLMAALSAVEPLKMEILKIDGKEYENATITKIDERVARISHDSGIARIQMQKLPGEIQKQIGFDPNLKGPVAGASARGVYLVECSAIKEVSGKYRYFFSIKNVSPTQQADAVKITLLHAQGMAMTSDVFTPKTPILPGVARVVFLEANTGPRSVHAEWSMVGFRVERMENGKVVGKSDGVLPSKIIK